MTPLPLLSQDYLITKPNLLADGTVIVTGVTYVRHLICFWDTPARSLKHKPLNFSTLIPTPPTDDEGFAEK